MNGRVAHAFSVSYLSFTTQRLPLSFAGTPRSRSYFWASVGKKTYEIDADLLASAVILIPPSTPKRKN